MKNWENLHTVGDAMDFVTELFNHQIEHAIGAEPNTAIDGDNDAKMAFLLLLPSVEKRIVFLRFVKKTVFWPRIRSLVGSPPFSFLLTEDEGILRPGGVARGRARMSKGVSDTYDVPGLGHFIDDFERRYEIVHHVDTHTDRMNMPIPFMSLDTGKTVIIDVRIKRRSRNERIRLIQAKQHAMLTFPSSGNRLVLTPTKQTMNVTTLRSVIVKSTQTSKFSKSLARLLCEVE
jgi:hypothetical protein